MPCAVQVESQPLLNTTRYRHFLATWKGQLLVVAGQVDDDTGSSVAVNNIIALDLNTRSWTAIKNFTLNGGRSGESHYILTTDDNMVINCAFVQANKDRVILALCVV